MEKKSDSYDAISSLLSDIDLPLQENMDVLLRAISVSTRSAVPEDPIYDNVANECDYENAESFRKSQSYIDVDELEQKAMYLNYDQMQTPPSENFKNILNSHQKKIGSKKSSTLHSYIDVIGELAEAGAFHSDSMTSSGYSKPSQDVLMQLKEVLKIPKKKIMAEWLEPWPLTARSFHRQTLTPLASLTGFRSMSDQVHGTAKTGFVDGENYDRFRPSYTDEVVKIIASIITDSQTGKDNNLQYDCVELGAGTGKLTKKLLNELSQYTSRVGYQ
eukprot:XP_019924627.1 PREDICTED: uncharacterized protein LOC109619286 [Crassostrea gigas]